MKDEPIPEDYYLKGPSEFAAPVEKESSKDGILYRALEDCYSIHKKKIPTEYHTYILKAMQFYSDLESARLRSLIEELIPIAERMLRIKQAKFMLNPEDDDAFEKSEQYKSVIERAKGTIQKG
jgi:hypothetical protein